MIIAPSSRRPRAPQTIIRRPLPSPHLTGTITRYTQGVLVGASHLPLANISQVTDYMFANFTQASSHAYSITYSSTFLTDLRGRSGFFFFFQNYFFLQFCFSFTMVIKQPGELRGESAAFGNRSASSMSK